MALRDSVYNALTGDVTLMNILTGGLYDASVVGEISRQFTPNAFDANREVKPCGLLRMDSTVPGAVYTRGAREFFSVYLYEFRGTANVENARARIFDLLHDKRLATGMWRILHTDDVRDASDAVLQCGLVISRYVGLVMR